MKAKNIGTLYQKDNGEYFFVPNPKQEPLKRGKIGKIVKQPTPEDVLISKERKKDYNLDKILKKHEMSSGKGW